MIKPEYDYKWNLADANFTKDRGNVFSCFACGGGSTMGYKLAGFDVIGCNEIDPQMIDIYKKNHNPRFAYLESIETFKSRDDLPKELFNLDILDGSPPCSSFSMAGDREKGWGKEKKFREGQAEQVLDNLFFDFIELADRLQPKVVVAENVQGMMLGNAIEYVQRIYTEFEKAGYYVQHWLLNSSDMGVPQSRPRVFFVCLRRDLADPFLESVDLFNQAPTLNLDFKGEKIPFGDVRSEKGKDYSHTDRGKLIHQAHPQDKCISDINLRVHNKNSGFNSLILHDHEVRGTITAGEKDWRFHDKMACSDMDYILCGSFPMDYDFSASTSKEFAKYVIGMSVPPLMTANIAHQIDKQWLSKL